MGKNALFCTSDISHSTMWSTIWGKSLSFPGIYDTKFWIVLLNASGLDNKLLTSSLFKDGFSSSKIYPASSGLEYIGSPESAIILTLFAVLSLLIIALATEFSFCAAFIYAFIRLWISSIMTILLLKLGN